MVCKKNMRMNFGALKAVLSPRFTRISREQETALVWRAHHFKQHVLASEPPDICVSEGQNSGDLAGIHIRREEIK